MIYKFFWFLRFLCYRPFFGRFGFPGYMGAPVFLMGVRRIFLGNKVRFFPGARIEVFEDGRLLIGDDVAVGQGVHITCKGVVDIGGGVCIAPYVCITDIRHSFTEVGRNILQQEDRVYETRIGKNCFLGYGAVIDAGTVLGEGCVVGANAYVSGNFPPYSIIVNAESSSVGRYSS